MKDDIPIISLKNNNVGRLFRTMPSDLYLHPDDLPTLPSLILDGPIEGWEAYAPNYHGDPSQVIGPFVPVVNRPYTDNTPVITVRTSQFQKSEFIYNMENDDGQPVIPCWYQSGNTLRFIRKKK